MPTGFDQPRRPEIKGSWFMPYLCVPALVANLLIFYHGLAYILLIIQSNVFIRPHGLVAPRADTARNGRPQDAEGSILWEGIFEGCFKGCV